MPSSCPWSSRPFHTLLGLLVFLYLVRSMHATVFNINKTFQFQTSSSLPNLLRLADLTSSIFGLGRTGEFRANISVNFSSEEARAQIALCDVTAIFVRDTSFQRRQRRINSPGIESLLKHHCTKNNINNNIFFVEKPLKSDVETYVFSHLDGLTPDRLYFVFGVVSLQRVHRKNLPVTISLTGKAVFQNLNTRYPQLGFEEALFPVFAATVMALLFTACALLIAVIPLTWLLKLHVSPALLAVLAACFLKALSAAMAFLYFYQVAQTGKRRAWHLYSRLILASPADVVFVSTVVSLSSGLLTMPSTWFVDGKSPVMLVYIAITLQVIIVIAVKIMFPYQYVGAVTYTIVGTVIAVLIVGSSLRNYRFLCRFSRLIERAHIYVKSTPINLFRLYFILNMVIATLVYVCKVISVSLFDYRLNRPDLLWGCTELPDTILLLLSTVFVLPSLRSALYTDMSNLNNERIRIADEWRSHRNGASSQMAARRRTSADSHPQSMLSDDGLGVLRGGDRSSHALSEAAVDILSTAATHANSTEAGTTANLSDAESSVTADNARRVSSTRVVQIEEEPQPPWVRWSSGMPLPVPDLATWGGQRREDGRLYGGAQRLYPMLPPAVVVGTEEGGGGQGVLHIDVGLPVAGPDARLRVVDEKGSDVNLVECAVGDEQRIAEGQPPQQLADKKVMGWLTAWYRERQEWPFGLSLKEGSQAEPNAGPSERAETPSLETNGEPERRYSQSSGCASRDGTLIPIEDGRDFG